MQRIKFEDKLKEKLLKFSGKKVLVAFSGGKDSSALLDYIAQNLYELQLSVVAIYINHHLREDVDKDLRYCKDFCIARGVEFLIRDIVADKADIKKCGIEAFARKNRYEILKSVREQIDADFIFTAHTLDDQIETFFINLFTSVSIYTLAGIKECDDKLYRPMLNISTDEVSEYLISRNIIPIFDSTNNDKRFIRNMLRHDLIPLIKKISSNDMVERNILKLQSESDNLSDYFYAKLQLSVLKKDENYLLIDSLKFDTMNRTEKEFILGYNFSKYFRVTNELLHNAANLQVSKTSKRIDMPDGYIFEVSCGKLHLFLASSVKQKIVIKKADEDSVGYDDKIIKFLGELKTSELEISRRKLGDRYNERKVKDILIDKKISLYDRDRLIFIRGKSGIIFIEGITVNNLIEIKYV